ncbi:S8 family serine peptidase [Pseudoalteromonas sp. BDTF-M6]|uniref:S8 family serine peptidase n=1 Tax=Pseudoalteromonas sp. BDTF-M6 TaxID=2796132 RepID=UPI001BAF8E6A|nr:S8 family serine peptidase [Pseudoalteromonas sp. BDTF-M6]MBS3797975.1 S8 family serine peptidase [Pseudoalteromonas sp. BDTF-M6]
MKKTTIASAVGVALFSAGTLYAAVGTDQQTTSVKNTLKAPAFTAQDVHALQKELNLDQQMDAQVQGVNVQLNAHQSKFVEENIDGEHIYIVRLKDASVAVAAKDPNSPLTRSLGDSNAKLFERGQPTSKAVVTYERQLRDKQQQVFQEVTGLTGRTEMRRQFTKAINGFSVKMTEQEAARIANLGSVASVMRSKHYDLLTDEGPKQISADQVWSGMASPTGVKHKGEGQIIGIIDTGINSDHPSFADIGGDGYDHANPWGAGQYVGDCVEDAEHIQCNDKLIGVRSYDVITDTYAEMIPGWPAIGEDYQGHGSHVASTAAGNVVKDVPYMIAGIGEEQDGKILADALFPEISGVAPHANIIAYQVCHSTNASGYAGCPGEALVAGIEDAISDGVDVINFSIGGADSNVWADPVQLAFLSAREAGINVAAAAGNSGTGVCGASECLGYLDNSSPWLAQVAATTHGRSVVIETGVEYAGFIDPAMGSEVPSWSEMGLVGGSINQEEITGVVVWAKDYADVNGTKDFNGYCAAEYPAGTFDFFKDGTAIPGAADGSTNVIVICQRHHPQDPNANARTAKVENVQAGGADGFIMYNRDSAQGTVPESYALPGVHFTYDQWNGVYPEDGLEDWVDSFSEKGHMITIKPTVVERRINAEDADWLARFSSRGPSFSNIEVLAPTLAAPGVNIYAAYSDEHPFVPTPFGLDYSMSSGTSMASPHVAGSMALIRQANPEWTAAEVQSALMMTADNVVQYWRLNQEGSQSDKAQIYRAGTGRINVANAVKSGLIMDESAENFLAADPYNGGTPHKLNLPNLVDFSCAPECQWVRTVKATKDGTWTVSHEDVVNWAFDMRQQAAQNGVNIEIIPETFSLKAGETQTIIVKASVMDTQDMFSNAEVELHTNLIFKAEEADIPDAHWPMAFKYDRGELPSRVGTVAHANKDTLVAKGITLPAVEAPVAHAYKPTKADVQTATIPKDDDSTYPWAMNRTDTVNPEDVLDEAVHSGFVTVPANSKRLILEVLDAESGLEGTPDLGNPLVYIGKDYNGDGVIQPQDEILCASNHSMIKNFCNINNPEEGEYWYMLYNNRDNGNEGFEETFEYAVAVVSDQISDDITASLPAGDGINTVDMTVAWNLDMEEGDVFYSMIDVGTSAVNPSNLGSIPFKLVRGVDRVNLDVPQDGAKIGDAVPFTFEVLANTTGMDRNFTFTAAIPEGLNIHADNVMSSRSDVNIEVADGVLTISGTQEDTSEVQPDYIVTDSITDQSCRTPNFGLPNSGGYVDLRMAGLAPFLSGFDPDTNEINYRNGHVLPVNWLYPELENISLYNNADALNYDYGVMAIRPTGEVSFSPGPHFRAWHSKYPYEAFPFESVAPLWRGFSPGFANDVMSLGLSSQEGITLARAGNWTVIEWDNASDYAYQGYDRMTGQTVWEKKDNLFDFEMIFTPYTRFGENEHEIYLAYDNIDFGSTDSRGSIGIQGFRGLLHPYGPLEGYLGRSINFNEVDEVVKDDMVICMDYVGPESSQFEVTAWADITPASAGRDMEFTANIDMDGMEPLVKSHTLSVPSNITVVELEDMTTNEEESITFDVAYIDELNSANEVLVSGDNMTAEVDGNTVTITPAQDFSGEIEVTVKVADIEHPSDAVSTNFILTVANVNDAPTAEVAQTAISATEGNTVTLDASASMDVDGDAITFEWEGPGTIESPNSAVTNVTGLSEGEHIFTVSVSDGDMVTTRDVVVTITAEQITVTPEPESKSSSGSLAWLLLLSPLAWFRRKKA